MDGSYLSDGSSGCHRVEIFSIDVKWICLNIQQVLEGTDRGSFWPLAYALFSPFGKNGLFILYLIHGQMQAKEN